MSRIAPHDARLSEIVAALAAVVLALVPAVLLIGGAVAQERTGDPAKGRDYFEKMMPVFLHPRCFNCHGGTDVVEGDNHGGGALADDTERQCIGCHTANTVLVPGRCAESDGRTAFVGPDGIARRGSCVPGEEQGEVRVAAGPVWNDTGPTFFDDVESMCSNMQGQGPSGLLEHLSNDALIGFAFEGRRAIYGGPLEPPAEPPPMSRAEFVDLARRWITEAVMACRTDGTVALADNVVLDSAPSPFGKTSVRNAIDAKIVIEKDVATSSLRYDETTTFAFRPVAPGCKPTSDGEAHFTAEGKPVTRYQIEVGPNLTYRMRFLLGAVEGQTDFAYTEQLCRPPQGRREQLPTEPATELRFGLDEWRTAEQGQFGSLTLRGSTTVPNDFVTGGSFISSGERKITWDIVIQ